MEKMNITPDTRIEDLGLSTRLFNVLKRNGIYTVRSILMCGLTYLSGLRPMGKMCIHELCTKLSSYGIEISKQQSISEEIARIIESQEKANNDFKAACEEGFSVTERYRELLIKYENFQQKRVALDEQIIKILNELSSMREKEAGRNAGR